jgi:hypothetical protein
MQLVPRADIHQALQQVALSLVKAAEPMSRLELVALANPQ